MALLEIHFRPPTPGRENRWDHNANVCIYHLLEEMAFLRQAWQKARQASDIQGRYAAAALNPGERGKL